MEAFSFVFPLRSLAGSAGPAPVVLVLGDSLSAAYGMETRQGWVALLQARLAGDRKQIERLSAGLAQRLYALPWLAVPPIGLGELSKLVCVPARTAAVAA